MKNMIFLVLILSGLICTSCTNAGASQIQSQDFPYSTAVRVGDMLYLSGIGGIMADGHVVPGGLGPETELAMKKIKAVLEKNNASLSNLVYCQVLLTNINDWDEFNKIYKTYFQNNQYPARTAFATTALAFNTHVEITCTAALGDLAKQMVFEK